MFFTQKYTGEPDLPTYSRFNDVNPGKKLLHKFNRMSSFRTKGILCDVVLLAPPSIEQSNFDNTFNVVVEAKGEQLVEIEPAHKLVLAACSDYFAAMFGHEASDLVESRSYRIVMRGLEAPILSLLIDYMYTGHIEIKENNVEKIFAAANLLQLPELVETCTDFFIKRLSPRNCCGIRSFADSLSCTRLFESSENYMIDHFLEVAKSSEFLLLPHDQFVSLLARDDLNVTREESVYLAAFKWILHEPELRKTYLASILQNIRLTELSPQFIEEHIFRNSIFTDDIDCQRMLTRTLLSHLLPGDKRLSHRGEECFRWIQDHVYNPRSGRDPESTSLTDSYIVTSSETKLKCARKGTLGLVVALGGMVAKKSSTCIEIYDYRQNCWHVHKEKTKKGNKPIWEILRSITDSLTTTDDFLNSISTNDSRSIFSLLTEPPTPNNNNNGMRQHNNHRRLEARHPEDYRFNPAHSPTSRCHNGRTAVGATLNRSAIPRNGSCMRPVNRRHLVPSVSTNQRAAPSQGNSSTVSPAVSSAVSSQFFPTYCGDTLSKRFQFGAIYLDGKIYIIGGRDGLKTLNSVDAYQVTLVPGDLNTDQPSNQQLKEEVQVEHPCRVKHKIKISNSSESCPGMITPRHGLGVAVMGSMIYAIGGHDGWSYLNTVERYDPICKTWNFVAQMDMARSTVSVATLGHKLYAIGGRDGNNILKTAECYDIHRDKWVRVASMNEARSCAGIVAINYSKETADISCSSRSTGHIYVAGGHNSFQKMGNVLSTVERYDPITNSWESLKDMLIPRDASALCALGNNHILAVAGYDGISYVASAEIYDINSNEWKFVAPLNVGRAGTCLVRIPFPNTNLGRDLKQIQSLKHSNDKNYDKNNENENFQPQHHHENETLSCQEEDDGNESEISVEQLPLELQSNTSINNEYVVGNNLSHITELMDDH